MLVSDIVRRNARFFADHDAIVEPGRPARSWRQVEERTNRMAHAFDRLGLGRGDRVAIFAPNCPEYLEFFFACAKSGVIGAALNIRLAAAEISSYLSYVEPAAVLVHGELAAAAAAWTAGTAGPRLIGMGEGHPFADDLADLMDSSPPDPVQAPVDDTDVYQLGATSGTTGVPKAAILTHRNAIAAMLNWLADLPIPAGGTALQNIPLFFNPGGPAGLHPVLMKGGRTVVPPAFDPAGVPRLIEEYQVTNTVMVPTMVAMVLDRPECRQHRLTSIRGIISGGSPVPAELLLRAREVFGGDVLYPTYGMAESYSCGTVLRPVDQHPDGTPEEIRRLSSAGKPHVLVQLRVVGDDGADVPADGRTPGEIWLAGDTMSPGYFNMDDETRASRRDGWFATGDVAVMDDQGFVTIVDRRKDMIITGGINVYSIEVERVLLGHPDVERAAVIGVPDPTWGETIHAVVVARAGATVDPDALVDFAAGRLAGYKKPRSVEVVDELPTSATGKVLKNVLRARRSTGAAEGLRWAQSQPAPDIGGTP